MDQGTPAKNRSVETHCSAGLDILSAPWSVSHVVNRRTKETEAMCFSDLYPIYLQIVNNIRRNILMGVLMTGDQLMSTAQYATTYHINPVTVNKTLVLLIDENLIKKRRRTGTFTTKETHGRLQESGQKSYADEILTPALTEGVALGLSSPGTLDMATGSLTALTEEKQ